MAQVAFGSISADCARTTKRLLCIVALSVPIHRFIVGSVLLSYTERCHSTVWRYVSFLNARQSSHSCYPQYWKNGFFDRTSLHSLGLIFHLGHDHDACPTESPPRDLTIIDMNGWHRVRVGFCTCDPNTPRIERYRQLLRMRWYPASFDRPRTAFSFDLLETYHKVSLQGKLNLYDFFLAIMQKSDNQGRSKPMVSGL